MTPVDIDRVFGRGRLQMVTGEHVEVFREASLPGERRRYTKRFLATPAGDFRAWTEREWRILARLVGHGVRAVPQVVQFDRGAADRPALVQTYDAGVTVDHWATLLPLERDGARLRNVFEDCAHWWALARHCLIALDAIHALQLVHLDLKADNVCIPAGPIDFDPRDPGATLHARFDDIALIDFAFSLVSGEPLESALPIAPQLDYEYQSPRLLRALDAGHFGDLGPTRQLDWRCDLFSLAAMLWRYLPELEDASFGAWTRARHAKARALVRRLIDAHDGALPALRPHAQLIDFAAEALRHPELSGSLQRGWHLTIDSGVAAALSPTPVTRIAMPVALPSAAGALNASADRGAARWSFDRTDAPAWLHLERTAVDVRALQRSERPRARRVAWAAGIAVAATAVASVPLLAPGWLTLPGARRAIDAVASNPLTRAASPGLHIAATLPANKAEREPSATTAPEPAPTTPSETGAKAPAATETPTTAHGTGEHALPAPSTGERTDSKPAPEVSPAGQAAPERESRPAAAQAQPEAKATAPAATTQAAAPTQRPQALARAGARSAGALGARGTLVPAAAPTAAPPRTVFAHAPRSASPANAPAHSGADARSRVHVAIAGPAIVARSPAPTRTWRDPAAPIPWAVAGLPAPRIAAAKAPPRALPGSASATNAAAPVLASAAPVSAPPPGGASAATATAAASLAVTASTSVAAATRELSSAPTAFPAARGGTAPPAATEAPVDLLVRANELMTRDVPRLAQQAERAVARVLYAAARSERLLEDEGVRADALAIARNADPLDGMTLLPRDAQQLNEAARTEYAKRGSTPEALMLQVRAFGANPLDAEVAGNLAFLLLRQKPAQAEAARQLALHALTLRSSRRPEGRIEDWATLAIASALSGRERDARNALLVTLALAPDLERECRAALDVVALYGERLRGPVEAMLQSAHASERARQSAFCEWPPHWVVGGAAR
ncbi:MAG TPA: hypothetical protein VGK95_12905 [Caldimonas sp.]